MILRVRLAFLTVALSLAVGSRPGYAQWTTNGAALCNAVGTQASPAIVSDGRGGAIVTWSDHRSGTSDDIYAQHVLASGVVDPAWTANGTVLCNAAGNQVSQQIVSDGRGGAIVAWFDGRGTNPDIYAQHVLASGVVDPAWTANGTLLCNAVGGQFQPQIVADGAGGAIVAWEDYRGGASGDIYAQHVQASGVVDPAWTANGTPLCNVVLDQAYPQMVSDGAGGAIVAWYDFRDGASLDIYAQHVRASGVVDPAWTANGTLVCGAANSQIYPQVVSDGAGGAIVAWQDRRSGTYDIYAQRVRASGVVDPAWTANGTLLCSAANDQDTPRMVADGAGGAIVSWQDLRGGATYDIYAQRVLPTGVVDPVWTANGSLVCNAASDQKNPQMVADGTGGAIVTWDDRRGGATTDIYVQRVQASGVVDPAWTADGTLLCNAANAQANPQIVSDGAGAIVTWQDDRGADTDVYAQRVYFLGGGGVAAVSPAAGGLERFAMRAPYPNPARAETAIGFDLATAQRVSVSVYAVTGQIVRTLVGERELPAGSQNLVWDGTSDAGAPAGAGVYFVRVTAGSASDARRVVFIR